MRSPVPGPNGCGYLQLLATFRALERARLGRTKRLPQDLHARISPSRGATKEERHIEQEPDQVG